MNATTTPTDLPLPRPFARIGGPRTPAPAMVGLHGCAGAGKTTLADLLADHGWTNIALADPLRAMALAIDPMVDTTPAPGEPHLPGFDNSAPVRLTDVVGSHGWELAKQLPDVRRLLQRLGTDGVRATFGATAWTDLADRRIRDCCLDKVVVSDVRFPDEADWVRQRGGIVLAVVRNGHRAGMDPTNRKHVSETSRVRPDAVVVNDSTPSRLLARALDRIGQQRPGWA